MRKNLKTTLSTNTGRVIGELKLESLSHTHGSHTLHLYFKYDISTFSLNKC